MKREGGLGLRGLGLRDLWFRVEGFKAEGWVGRLGLTGDDGCRWSHPEWLYKLWAKRFGAEKTKELMRSQHSKP